VQLNRNAVRNGVLAAGTFFVLAGVVTGPVPTPIFDRMVPRTPLDYTFLLLTTALAGGFFAVACPHCNAILVALFGSSWLATYVDPIRPLFGIAALGLLGGILYARRGASE
jgi:hypothetical protein